MSIKVLIVEHSLPFYHVPAWIEVSRHPDIDLTIAYGRGFFTGQDGGVPEGSLDAVEAIKKVVEPSIIKGVAGKHILWHGAAVKELSANTYDVVIQQFETKMLSLWKIRNIQKQRKQHFILWGIGESLKPTPFLDVFRRFLARTASAMVFYADKNRERYAEMGLKREKLFVARNLIDIKPIQEAARKYSSSDIEALKIDRGIVQGPVLLSVGRLLKRKRNDLLLLTLQKLLPDFPHMQVVIIGDGPEMDELKNMAQSLGVHENTKFLGKISDEDELASWFLSSDLVVAPGQIGHLATHAHAYGVPLITGDDRSVQGPEVEILLRGETGMVYKYDQLDSLTTTVRTLLEDEPRRKEMAERALRRANEFCGVEKMAEGFIDAIQYVMKRNAGEK